jgi:hypothetical protein
MSNELLLTALGVGSGTVLGVGLGAAVLLWFIKTSVETLAAGAKTAAEEGAKAAINDMHWPEKLRQEIEKSRSVERQDLRFKSYGALWKQLRPLAIYSDDSVDQASVRKLSNELSNWYFSECGGMYLLSHTRTFYFALQDFARTVSISEDWSCQRYVGDYKETFNRVLDRFQLIQAKKVMISLAPDTIPESWPEGADQLARGWKMDLGKLAADWIKLSVEERFATIQQIGSKLRTIMVYDIESRLR